MISHGNRTEWRTIQGVIGLVIISNLLSNYEPDYSGRSVKEATRVHSRQVVQTRATEKLSHCH